MTNNVTKVTNKPCIVKDSYEVWTLLKSRFARLMITDVEVCRDAKDHGKSITASVMSKYMKGFDEVTKKRKGGVEAGMSQENILWLCERYGIEVTLEPKLLPFGKIPYAIDNKIRD